MATNKNPLGRSPHRFAKGVAIISWVFGLLYAVKTAIGITSNDLSAVDVVLTLLLWALAIFYTLMWRKAKPYPAKSRP